ncbi:MAG: acetamidase/formamidase family protein [Dehalococcoidia bacterium]
MPVTHTFEPTVYYTAIGPHPPALHIEPGDTVVTSTVCSGGMDRHGAQVTPGGNPQTGPFYIEGAEPGDVIAVRVDRVVPNRPFGRTNTMLAPNVVDPGFVHELPADRGGGVWQVDTDAWTATLVEPETPLGRFTTVLEPMMGCFGVAPARGQSISCATSGPHGGNMDYRGFKEGVTMYLPVFVPGALFQLGDGHALQGDGEIVGTGIEISMDVTFSAWIHRKQQPINWPRAENDEFIMAAGNARPLDQAVQHATTELLRWMTEDYALDYRAASTLLGQCIRYGVGNVFDPAYTMIAKVEKRLLEPYRKG